MAVEKIKILGAVLELPAKYHCQSSPFTSKIGPNGLNWQCCLAGSSKMAPRILIFSITIGADYSFDIKSGFSIAPAFSLHNNFDIASVIIHPSYECLLWYQELHQNYQNNSKHSSLRFQNLNQTLNF